uniref:uncharacterized protein LOC100186190 isoform X2 n=1 Tax=Ciona intestinalis TaxID=7719 RepID=UPI00089DAF68|nr:uncharacterized protein LOC100186190 isoform X2 [Ciona intestinalis]|eukprot:XP_018673092.1 uncharacterized protein LOC100186190 isoform X2 [Ciona intestinalis]
MNIRVSDLHHLPGELQKAATSVFWRGDSQDISTALLTPIPSVFLHTVVRKGGISTALCYAILHSYPEASVSNFRQLTDSQLIFTVENEGQLIDDIKGGVGNRKLNSTLQDLPSLLEDSFFNIFQEVHLSFHLERQSSCAGGSSIKSKETIEQVDTSVSDVPPNTNKTTSINIQEMMDLIAQDDGASLFEEGKYGEALFYLETYLKTVSGLERSLVQLKLALCLRASKRESECNPLITEALTYIEKTPHLSDQCLKYAEALRNVGCKYRNEAAYSRSVLIFSASAFAFSKCLNASHVAIGMTNCMTDMKIVADTDKSTVKCKELVRHTFLKVLNLLEAMTKCDELIEALGTGYMYLGRLYKHNPRTAVVCYRKVIASLEEWFGENDARKRSDYGTTTHNLAHTLQEMGENFEEVERLFEAAIERQEAANDWENSSATKEECLKKSFSALKEVRTRRLFTKAQSTSQQATLTSVSKINIIGTENEASIGQNSTNTSEFVSFPVESQAKHSSDSTTSGGITTTESTEHSENYMFQLLELENGDELWERQEYTQAMPIYERCQNHLSSTDKPLYMLKLALCLSQGNKREESKKLLTTTLQNLEQDPPVNYHCFKLGEAVRQIGQRYFRCGCYSMATLVVISAAKLFARCTDVSNGPKGILNCMNDLRNCVKRHSTSFQHQLNVEKVLTQFIDMIKSFPSSETARKANILGRAYSVMGNFFLKTGKEKAAEQSYLSGIKSYEEAFGTKAETYSTYGICTHNLASLMQEYGKYKEAEMLVKQAIERQNAATNWHSEREKEESLRKSQSLLAHLKR